MTKGARHPEESTPYDVWFELAEKKYELPPGLLKAIAFTESRYRENADAGPRGGKGLMQFVRSTAREYGIDPFKPQESIFAAGLYMRRALNAFNNNIEHAVQAYNMGIGGAREFFGGNRSVEGDPEYRNKVLRALERISARSVINRAQNMPRMTDAEASFAVDPKIRVPEEEPTSAFGLSASAADIAPTRPGWLDAIGPIEMLNRLSAEFDSINAEHEADARDRLAELERSLAGDNA